MPERAASTAAPSIPDRLFGVVTDRQTYRNLAYLLLRFPLGIAYFTTFVTGIALGLALVPLVVGIPILLAVLGLAEYVALVEAALLRRLLDRDVDWEPTDPGELPLWPYLKTVATTPRNYALVAYFLATFAVGTAVFVAMTVVFSLSLAYLFAPLLYWIPGVEYGPVGATDRVVVDIGPSMFQIDTGGFGVLAVDTFPEALVAAVFGAALGVAALHVFDAVARGLGSLTAFLLGAE